MLRAAGDLGLDAGAAQVALDLVERVPTMRFNGDFSHWYTGAEMTYGDLAAKIERLSPVLARTRFLHGRVSDPGCAQVAIGGGANAQHLAVFRDFWTRAFRGFLAEAAPGDVIGFYPELLSPAFHYARQQGNNDLAKMLIKG